MAREYIGAGWRKQTNSGVDFINLKINDDANVQNGEFLKLYKAREKRSDNSPDYNLCRETNDDGPQGNQSGNRGQGNRNQNQQRPRDNQQGNRGNQGGNYQQRPQGNQSRRNDPPPGDDFGMDDCPF